MGKKFMGLGGTDHFWDRAKAWILNQITSAVTAKIAEVVADAPEDLDTLKEIADWISAHADDAAAMNTQITENKNNIAANSSSISAMNTQITENKNNIAANSSSISALNTQIQTNKDNIATNTSDISALKTSVAGKADKSHTHTKSEITDFPKTIKFADYKTESLTFSSLTDQKRIELEKFGSDVTEDNVLSFMVIYWTGVQIIASGDWAKSQGTGSSGLSCALHSLNAGTGYCVIRCVYLA